MSYSQIYVSSPYPKYLNEWKKYGANVSTDNGEVAEKADVIFLAIKPVIFPQVMTNLLASRKSENIQNKLFVSILAGITIEELEKVLPSAQLQNCSRKWTGLLCFRL